MFLRQLSDEPTKHHQTSCFREAKKKAEKQAPSERPKHQEVSTVTTADLEREWEKELSEFQPASRITGIHEQSSLMPDLEYFTPTF